MTSVSIIRQRGQLTIPDSIRKVANWITPLSPITITLVKPDEIIITPHRKEIDWDKIWDNIRASRAIEGKGNMSASAFIDKDRTSH